MYFKAYIFIIREHTLPQLIIVAYNLSEKNFKEKKY